MVGTVLQSLDNAHAYVFRDIEIANIGKGSATNGPSSHSSVGVDNVSQLYTAVKSIPRNDMLSNGKNILRRFFMYCTFPSDYGMFFLSGYLDS